MSDRTESSIGMLGAPDALAILQLVTRADTCATNRDVAGYVALFTEDGVMDGVMGTFRGRDALGAAVAKVWATEPPDTLHLTLNSLFDGSGTDPVVDSVMLMVTRTAPSTIVGTAKVRQTFTLGPEGWLITRRTIT